MKEQNFYTVRGYQLLEQHKNILTPSLEDYLEMIFRGVLENGYVRVNTLANDLHVRPPSASKMIHKLRELGLVDYEKYGIVQLTQQGKELGAYLLWRHNIVSRFFTLIADGQKPEQFAETELTEHMLGKNTVECLEWLTMFFTEYPEIYKTYQTYIHSQKEPESLI